MRRRKSMLFIPGNNPGMLCNSVVLGADALIFDLEDAVALREKDAARVLVRNALRHVDHSQVEVFVRINSLDSAFWREDVRAVVQGGADGILLPKCDGAAAIQKLAQAVEEEEARAAQDSASKGCPKNGCGSPPLPEKNLCFLALVESALGVERAFEIATSHPRVDGLFLGAEDLSADLHAKRSKSGEEILYARLRLLTAARAAGIQAIDTPFTDVNDTEGLEQDAALACRLGFDGKAVISPHHVEAVNAAFMPTSKELDWALRVLAAERKALEEGKGVVSLDGKMVDMPVILRARHIAEQGAQSQQQGQSGQGQGGQDRQNVSCTQGKPEVCHA